MQGNVILRTDLDISGNYRITDYEVPVIFYSKGIGEIRDLD